MPRNSVRFLPAAVVALALAVTLPGAGIRAQGSDILTFLFRIGTPILLSEWDAPAGELPQRDTLEPGEMVYPMGLAVDSQGRIIVTNTEAYGPDIFSNRVQVFNANGALHLELSAAPPTAAFPDGTDFYYPTGAAVDANDRVVIVDAGNNRVLVLDSVANGIGLLAEFGSYGNYDPFDAAGLPGPAPLDQLNFPTTAALKPGTRLLDPLDTEGRLVLVDTGNHRFVLLDSMLNPLMAVGLDPSVSDDVNPPGAFFYPWGVAMDADGRMFVADSYNHRVQAFDSTGAWLWQFGSVGETNQPDVLQDPTGVALDHAGRLFVSDTARSRVLRLDMAVDLGTGSSLPLCSDTALVSHGQRCQVSLSDGRTVRALVIGEFGSGDDGQFVYPHSVAETPTRQILVVDTNKHVLQAFEVADLTVQSAVAGPGQVGGLLTLDVVVANTGSATLTTTPHVTASLAGQITLPASQSIPGNSSATFSVGFAPAEAGQVEFEVTATGVHAMAGTVTSAPLTSAPITIAPAPAPFLSASLAASPGVVGVDGAITVSLTLINGGGVTFDALDPTVTVQPAGSPVVTPVAGSHDLSPLAPGETRILTYSFLGAQPGTVSFAATVAATSADPLDQTPVHYPSVQASSGAVTVQIDVTPPVTTATFTSTVEPQSGWYRAPVTVTLTASDHGGTGVKSVEYTVFGLITGGGIVPGAVANFTVSHTGVTNFNYRAEDLVGNVEALKTGQVRIDTVPPDITSVTVLPAPNAAGWNRTDVQANFVAGDGNSGVAFVTPVADTTVTTEGAGQVIRGIARDLAGNEAFRDVVVNVDKTPPTLICAPDRLPDHNGWYRSAVTVTCTAADQPGLSGVAYVTPPQTLTADGIHTFLGEALDHAGNLATVTLTIKVDKTPPVMMACSTLSGGETWPPNHKLNPWTVTVTPSDPVSGVASLKLVAYWSNEPDNEKGDGNFENDMQGWVLGTPDLSGFIRAERAGSKGGRTYTLRYEAIDNAGNTESCEITTGVPHDQGKGKP